MKWLIFGIFSTLMFGFWTFFAKLSSFEGPFISNFLIYLSSLIITVFILLIKRKKIKFSRYAVFAGLIAGLQGTMLLYSFSKNQLILVLPFISFASVVFFLLIYFKEKPKYKIIQKILVIAGLFLSTVGILVVATGTVGFFTFIHQLSLDITYLSLGLAIMIATSAITYFAYRASQTEITGNDYAFWNLSASLFFATVIMIFASPTSFSQILSFNLLGYLYPAVSGICVTFGILFYFAAFQSTTSKSKIQETVVGILLNSELIPVTFLSYFILGERVTEGFIGSMILLIGLIILNYSDVLKK